MSEKIDKMDTSTTLPRFASMMEEEEKDDSKNASFHRKRLAQTKDLAAQMEKTVKLVIVKNDESDEHLTLVHEIDKDGLMNIVLQHDFETSVEGQGDWKTAAMKSLELHLPRDFATNVDFLPPKKEVNEIRVVLPQTVVDATWNEDSPRAYTMRRNSLTCWMWRRDSKTIENQESGSSCSSSRDDEQEKNEDSLILFDMTLSEGKSISSVAEVLENRWHFSKEEVSRHILAGIDQINVNTAQEIITRVSNLVVKLDHGLEISEDVRQAIRGVFSSESRVEVTKLCGGWSGAQVFRCTGYSFNGEKQTPCVVKTDDAGKLACEATRMEEFVPFLGENAPKILSRFQFMTTGALKIELCGSAWSLPELQTPVTITTFKDMYAAELSEEGSRTVSCHGEVETVIGEVFGSILRGGALDHSFIQKGTSIFSEDCYPILRQLEKHKKHLTQHEELFQELRQEIEAYESEKQGLQCLMGHVHGDLNGANILIDSEGIVWLIDFAFSGEGPVLKDICKFENTILLEYTSTIHPQYHVLVDSLVNGDVSTLPTLNRLGLDLALPGAQELEQAWNCILRLRHFAGMYIAKDPNPLALQVGRLYYAIKTLAFREISESQKEFALYAAVGHAKRVIQLLRLRKAADGHSKEEPSGQLEEKLDNAFTIQLLERERVKYVTSIGAKEAYFVDPVSRSRLSVLKQCVNLTLHEGGDITTDKEMEVIDQLRGSDLVVQKIRNALGALETTISSLTANTLNQESLDAILLENHGLLCSLGRSECIESIELAREILGIFPNRKPFIFKQELPFVLLETILRSGACDDTQTTEVNRFLRELDRAPYLEQVNKLLPDGMDIVGNTRICLLGAPAAGKSVFLRKLTVLAATHQDFRRTKYPLVPLRILLIDLGRLVAKQNLTSHDDLLGVYLDHKYGHSSSKTMFLKRAIVTGRVFLLLDGFDEAGSNASVIVEWLTELLRRSPRQKVVVSSRQVGFSEFSNAFHGQNFRILTLQQLTPDMIESVVDRRVTEVELAEHLKTQLVRHEYAALAQNPLMLSLLIHVLSLLKKTKSEPSDKKAFHLTRNKLFSIAIEQMLFRANSAKYKKRSGDQDKLIEKDFLLLEDSRAIQMLRQVAYLTHVKQNRDISMKEFAEVIGLELDSPEYEENSFMTMVHIFNALQRHIGRGIVPLFTIRDDAVGQHNQKEAFERKVMFSHLTLQENLAAAFVADRLVALNKSEEAKQNLEPFLFVTFGGDRLEHPWYHEMLLITVEILSETQKDLLSTLFGFLTQQITEGARSSFWFAAASSGSFQAFEQFYILRGSFDWERLFASQDTQERNTFLHFACKFNHPEFIRKVIDLIGFDAIVRVLETRNNLDFVPMLLATFLGHLECVRLLANTTGDREIRRENSDTVPEITKAVKLGDVRMVKDLLDRDPKNLYIKSNPTSLTPMKWACIKGNAELLTLMVERDQEQKTYLGEAGDQLSPLLFAVEHNSLACAKVLLDHGADPMSQNSTRANMIIIAGCLGFDEMALLLMKYGNGMEGAKEYVCMLCLQGRVKQIEMMLRKGIKIEDCSLSGCSAMLHAAINGKVEVTRCLLANGGDVNDSGMEYSVDGNTPLQIAVFHGKLELASELLKAGADPNMVTKYDTYTRQTALSIACKKSISDPLREPLIQLLKNYGAKENLEK